MFVVLFDSCYIIKHNESMYLDYSLRFSDRVYRGGLVRFASLQDRIGDSLMVIVDSFIAGLIGESDAQCCP